MMSITRSTNQFINGTKPRLFFEARKNQMDKETMLNTVSKDHYPKWSPSKHYNNSEYENPELSSILEMAPWVLAILIAVISIF